MSASVPYFIVCMHDNIRHQTAELRTRREKSGTKSQYQETHTPCSLFIAALCIPLTQGGAARALVAHEVAADVLIEVGADVAAEILQDVLVPGMAIATVFRVGWRIVFGRRQRGDRRRFVFAAFRAAITGGVL